MFLYADIFRRLSRKCAPTSLNDCPMLHVVFFYADADDDFFIEFPRDDSAMASDGQAVAKWLFTPRPDNMPKVFKCRIDKDGGNLATKIEAFKSVLIINYGAALSLGVTGDN
ncbi:hypothetical protein niasHT_014569 [Heterodera trifolii]|uniref:Uncharacterized protein n=1 Tax=Heterodera trifolii TaxID=157864 RepID=A0ABD2LHP9_9BILA